MSADHPDRTAAGAQHIIGWSTCHAIRVQTLVQNLISKRVPQRDFSEEHSFNLKLHLFFYLATFWFRDLFSRIINVCLRYFK